MLTHNDYLRIAIQQNVKTIFGYATKVYLFGSRVDDSKKGGDIDLYVVPENQDNLHEKKIKFLTALDLALGEQKIDVIIATDNTERNDFCLY
ncbi:DNA polymerase beta domain protein region (fragment) [Crenothrix polyspora]|uniref:DNA polymerase beta domain protein region n=1 Tax=Crenothrix polyspora TaxID=360316 RepID=A0A1R4HC98_9GAMM